MPLHIRITQPARRDIRIVARWYAEHAVKLGQRWSAGVSSAIESLRNNPDRCALAHETDQFEFEVRELLYGSGRKKTHRILFRIVEDTVEVLAVRHVAQEEFRSDDI
ncbi:MAG: type II toxin-antitoxin system RelE/ParE family toxin [Planctomycetes bacterium]|nr:type II toxin-antitoxin system RelE/ParE family toxin [Planctomycetota bacterium]